MWNRRKVSCPVIFLNGTSSSGKTSIAKALQAVLPDTWLHVSVDTFLEMASDRRALDFKPFLRGYHASIGALATAGNRLIVDHVLQQGAWLRETADALGDTPVLFVGLRCPLEVLEQRERTRGDRGRGTARKQFPLIHRHGAYDVEIDTSTTTPEGAAAVIAELVTNGQVPPSLRAR